MLPSLVLADAADKVGKPARKFESQAFAYSLDLADSSYTLSIDYSADLARFRPADCREFTEFHRVLMNSIEQPFVLR